LFFLIPGDTYSPGVNLGALLPLRSLRFLGLPDAALKWFATSTALAAWHTLANFIVPLAMCVLGVYLLLTRRLNHSAQHAKPLEPLELRSIRTTVPYAVLMVLVVIAYGMVPPHDAGAAISATYHGVNRYAFTKSIFSWRHWTLLHYWTTKHPYRDISVGSWWGSILVLGPLGIAAWGALALKASRRAAPRRGDVSDDAGRSPGPARN
jgi:hypothetical protein